MHPHGGLDNRLNLHVALRPWFQLQSSQSALTFNTYDNAAAITNRHTAARLVDGYPDQWVLRFKPDPS